MKEFLAKAFVLLLALLIAGYAFVLPVRKVINEYFFQVKVVDEETNYQTRKMVEDTARSMISNYEFAVGEYESYKIFCETEKYHEDKCQRALDSKSSANRTVATYNNYILKNEFLFKGNLPADIYYSLQAIN